MENERSYIHIISRKHHLKSILYERIILYTKQTICQKYDMNISRKQKKACDFEIEWYEKISSQDKDSR